MNLFSVAVTHLRTQAIPRIGIAVIAALLLPGCSRPTGRDLSPAKINALLSDSLVVVLDVRTPSEWQSETGHLDRAILIPVQELDDRIGELEAFRKDTIIAYCRSGQRSAIAADLLRQHGFTAFNMEGGILRWNDEQRPVTREQQP